MISEIVMEQRDFEVVFHVDHDKLKDADLHLINKFFSGDERRLKIYDNNEFSHQVIAPISGKIIDINEKVIVNKSLLEKDPYFQGWIYRMIPENLEHEINNIIPCSSDIWNNLFIVI